MVISTGFSQKEDGSQRAKCIKLNPWKKSGNWTMLPVMLYIFFWRRHWYSCSVTWWPLVIWDLSRLARMVFVVNFIAEDKSRIKSRLKASQTFLIVKIICSRRQCLFHSGYIPGKCILNMMKVNTFALQTKICFYFFPVLMIKWKKRFFFIM